jgi:hypothetical protein
VEAELKKDPDLQVEVVNGKMVELRVEIEGADDVKTSALAYPAPSSVVKQVRERLSEKK